jgi:hypothetical protein
MRGTVQDVSFVTSVPGPVAPVEKTAAAHTSNGDRYRLKSSTSFELRPSRKRTLTAFTRFVVLTTETSVWLPSLTV